jgi:hypothetical protein
VDAIEQLRADFLRDRRRTNSPRPVGLEKPSRSQNRDLTRCHCGSSLAPLLPIAGGFVSLSFVSRAGSVSTQHRKAKHGSGTTPPKQAGRSDIQRVTTQRPVSRFLVRHPPSQGSVHVRKSFFDTSQGPANQRQETDASPGTPSGPPRKPTNFQRQLRTAESLGLSRAA